MILTLVHMSKECYKVSRKHKNKFTVPKGTWIQLPNINPMTHMKGFTQTALCPQEVHK